MTDKKKQTEPEHSVLEEATVSFMLGALKLASNIIKTDKTTPQEPIDDNDSFKNFDHFGKPK